MKESDEKIKELNNHLNDKNIKVFSIDYYEGIKSVRVLFYTHVNETRLSDSGDEIVSISGIISPSDSLEDLKKTILDDLNSSSN